LLFLGDCLLILPTLPDNSVDSVVTDPPYGLSFMGKKWDYDVPSVEIWREVFRVLKPGGHLLAFGGTRTYHRLVVAIEDAGFEIRDQVQWIYGQGFPKSLDVSKAIDKAAGAHVEKGDKFNVVGGTDASNGGSKFRSDHPEYVKRTPETPETPEAIQWQGWGTALKPANEPICLARKPLEKGLTVAENVQKWGTGAINVDGCRVEAKDGDALAKNWDRTQSAAAKGNASGAMGLSAIDLRGRAPTGRFPANVILDEVAGELLDQMAAGYGRSNGNKTNDKSGHQNEYVGGELINKISGPCYSDKGGVSRFFYCAKASTSERNAGLEGMPEKSTYVRDGANNPSPNRQIRADNAVKNVHPTVKPIKLMEYLCRLITPPGGTILDPFMGSGTTGIAAKRLGFDFIGIEMNPEYFAIAEKRILNAQVEAPEENPQVEMAEA
jgi:DNA modification methylase